VHIRLTAGVKENRPLEVQAISPNVFVEFQYIPASSGLKYWVASCPSASSEVTIGVKDPAQNAAGRAKRADQRIV
jgi:hypothetical protein